MIRQGELLEKHICPGDVVFTRNEVAEEAVRWLKPNGLCLDPCRGDGAFYQYLPAGAEWCELKEGKDFFDYKKPVDWIIGNPPYSLFEEWLCHSFELANYVAYLVPTNKVFQRQVIMEMICEYGGIKKMMVYGSGQSIGFPFGFSVGLFYFCRDYKGACEIVLGNKNRRELWPH